MNKIYFVLIFLIFAVIIFGLQKRQDKTAMLKKLRLVFQEGNPPSLHPHLNIGHTRCVTLNKLLFEGLTRIDENQKAVLAGADSVNISKDKTEYTFTLRNSKWSNGKQVTAYDYETAWRSAISQDSLCLRPDVFYIIKNAEAIRQGKKNIKEFGAKALDEKTLQIKIAYPCTTFLELIASSIFAPIKESEPTFFNGPFVVAKWHKAKNLILAKNQNYWDKKNIQLDTVDISFVRDSTAGFLLFQKQKIDWAGSPINALSLEYNSILEKSNLLQKRLSRLNFWMYINTKLTHFKSKNIRKALSYALDRKLINDQILPGKMPISFLPTAMAPFKQVFEYNPEKARESFSKGLKELSILKEDFPEIKLSFFTYPGMKELAQYLEKTWNEVLGIKINLVEKDWNSFINSLEKGDYEIGGFNEVSTFPGPVDLLERLKNKEGWENEAYQKALLAMKYALDEKQKAPFLKKALEILADEMPIIVLSNKEQTFSTNPLLKGYYFDYTNSVDFSRAYFEK